MGWLGLRYQTEAARGQFTKSLATPQLAWAIAVDASRRDALSQRFMTSLLLSIGRFPWLWHDELDQEPLEEFQRRIKAQLGNIPQPRSLLKPHQLIAHLMKQDLFGQRSRYKDKAKNYPIRFRLTLKEFWINPKKHLQVWEDSYHRKLEGFLREIAEEVILAMVSQYQRVLDRKRSIEEKDRAQRKENARKEQKRIQDIHQARFQKFLDDAAAYRQACDIREFVVQVLDSNNNSSNQDRR